MDLGIAGKWAIVCGSSKGLGFGCASALAQEGVNLVINGRELSSLMEAVNYFKNNYSVEIKQVQADVTTSEGQDALLSECSNPDILITNAAGPKAGFWKDWEREDFIKALDSNMLTPISLMKRILPTMMERKWGRVVNITSQSVKAPIPVLGLSNSARAGLTGYVAGTSRQVAPFGVIINNLLPGIHDTSRSAYLDSESAKADGISVEEATANRKKTIPVKRYGTIEEFGAICAFLCSQHAGFMVGQNILSDGGAVNATL